MALTLELETLFLEALNTERTHAHALWLLHRAYLESGAVDIGQSVVGTDPDVAV